MTATVPSGRTSAAWARPSQASRPGEAPEPTTATPSGAWGRMFQGARARQRYVFALEPRTAKGGKRAVEPVAFEGVKHDLDANGYIGNLAVELISHGGFDTVGELTPRPGASFRYTSGTSEKGVHALRCTLSFLLSCS